MEDLDRNEAKRAQSYFKTLLDVYCAEISKTFTSKPLDFYHSLYLRTISWLDDGCSGTLPFSKFESQIQQLRSTVTLHKNKIHNLFGNNDLYVQYTSFLELIREHVACIDELEYGRLVDGLVSEEQLYQKHRERRCVYQNPSLVPFLLRVKVLV
ncbi:hypothetical protein PM082_002331 [Marasmius tenuissimus]|nr:hypothetical protein PM082_002331 [Marasmius tenuissimus]